MFVSLLVRISFILFCCIEYSASRGYVWPMHTPEETVPENQQEQTVITDLLMGANELTTAPVLTEDFDNNVILAIHHGVTEVLEQAWEHSRKNELGLGLIVNNSDEERFISPLYFALCRGNGPIIEKMLSLGAKTTALDEEFDSNPLSVVATHGHTHLIEYVIEHMTGMQALNQFNNNGLTPLFAACQMGHFETVKKLLALGADPLQGSMKGASPLDVAVEKGFDEIVHLFLQKGYCKDISKALILASEDKRVDFMEDLLTYAERAQPASLVLNKFNELGVTPLMVLLQNDHNQEALRLIKLLALNNDDSLNFQDPYHKYTALHIAVGNGQLEVVKALLAIPFLNINLLDRENYSPLYLAVFKNNLPIITALLAVENSELEHAVQGRTALELAFDKRTLEVVDALLKKHAVSQDFLPFSRNTLFKGLVRAAYLYHLFHETQQDRTLLGCIITSLVTFLKKDVEQLRKEMGICAHHLDEGEKRVRVKGRAGLALYEAEVQAVPLTREQEEKAHKNAQRLIQEEADRIDKAAREVARIKNNALAKKKKNKKKKPAAASLEACPAEDARPITTTTSRSRVAGADASSSLSVSLGALVLTDQSSSQPFEEPKKLSKKQKRKEREKALEIVPRYFVDEAMFSYGPATLHLDEQKQLLDSNCQSYLRNYERHERVVQQQSLCKDYHTFSDCVETWWAPFACKSEDDLTSAQTRSLFAARGTCYTKKITFTIRGRVNNTSGKFEFVLLVPTIVTPVNRPLCIHRFFAPDVKVVTH